MTDPGLALPVTLRLRVTLPPTRSVVMRKFNYQTTGNQGKIEVQFLTSVYIQGTVPLTVNRCCSYSTTIGTGPDTSAFRVARSKPELGPILCAAVRPRGSYAATFNTLSSESKVVL